ncbi:MAG: hypothetical protein LBF95_08100 [Treponema sp.]|jgi:hypothetical protein|nr:hypothetical protein [Treponema sp.]
MKRIIMVCVLVLVSGCVFAQEMPRETGKKNAVFVDLGYPIMGLIFGGFGIGGGYERAALPQVSISGNVGYVGFTLNDVEYLGFDISAVIRYYPSGMAVSKFYIGAMGSCSPLSITYNGSKETSYPLTVAGMAGWKNVAGGGFFWEPYVGYRKSFGELKLPAGLGNLDYELTGLMFGVGLGWAF